MSESQESSAEAAASGESGEPQEKPWVVNATHENFVEVTTVLSKTMPVVIDFWAPWCQPCRMLAPALEEHAAKANGQFTLVKVNIDELQEEAQQFQVSSIPAVFAMVDGELVDHFTGLLDDEQMEQWINNLQSHRRVAEARRLEDTSPAEAKAIYEELLQEFPDNELLMLGVAQCELALGQTDAARAVIGQLEANGPLSPEAEKIQAKLDLGSHRGDDLQDLRDTVANDSQNLQAKKALADALAAKGEFEESMDLCLELIELDPNGVGEEARKRILDIFKLLPEGSEIVNEYRRRLTTLLF